ncbi:MAG: thermonuclease family protein, partial [Nanoarchaeota archaeon]|nr:thermonuclease family protein [Nanoarchaeota archaeon]
IYGRLLRYVFYNDKLINEDILKRGLAHYYSYSEDDFTNRLKKAEETARKNQIGIWEKSKDKCSECIVLKELNEIDPGEYLILENICGFNCDLNLWTIKDDATHTKKLDFEINAKQEKKIDYEGRIWNDDGDSLYLRDENGLLVLFWRY